MNIKSLIPVVAKFFGATLMTKEATVDTLMGSELFFEEGEPITIPPTKTWGIAPAEFEVKQENKSAGIGVFKLPTDQKIKIFNYGGIKMGGKVLNLDFGCSLFIKTLIQRDKRPVLEVENCIPLWSHFWGNGYYDYLFFVYAKFLRLASALDKDTLSSVKITYPIFNTSFEKELWKLAGINEDQLIDSRKYKVKAKNYFVANTQSWYYQHKTDIKLLQQTIQKVKVEVKPEYERIYISRKGRRKLLNEDALIEVLKPLNFTVIEDTPRTVAEQMIIFNNARIIVGPHGAAFTNILWCKPQATLLELFPKNYYPPYFRALSASLHINYAAVFEAGIQDTHFSHMNEDLTIDIPTVKKSVEEIIAGLK